MKKIYLSITMLFAVCAANAADVVFPAPAKAVKLDAPWGIAPSQTITVTNVAGHKPFYIPDTGEKIIWSATAKELFIDGGVPFSLSGRKYVLKRIHLGGAYYEVADITDVEQGKILISQLWDWEVSTKVRFPATTLIFSVANGKLSIADGAQFTVVLDDTDIFRAWSDNTKRYCAQHFGKNICLVPQEIWNDRGDNTGHVGFEIALADDIWLNSEFLRLFEYKSGGDLIPYAPINFSVFATTTIYYTGNYTGNSSEFLLSKMTEGDYWAAMGYLMLSEYPEDKVTLGMFNVQYPDK